MLKSILTALALCAASTGATAATLTLDGTAKFFDNQFGTSKGDPTQSAWVDSFDFEVDAGQTAYLSIVEFREAGDIFGIEINGVFAGLTSTPSGVAAYFDKTTFGNLQDGINRAFLDARFSSGQIALSEGRYLVTGFVSNYDPANSTASGYAMLTGSPTDAPALRAAASPSAAVVPLPAAGWLLLAAIAGIGLMRRKQTDA